MQLFVCQGLEEKEETDGRLFILEHQTELACLGMECGWNFAVTCCRFNDR